MVAFMSTRQYRLQTNCLIEVNSAESRRSRRQYTYSCVLRRWRPDVEWSRNLGAAGLRRHPFTPSPSSLFVGGGVDAPCQWTRNLLHRHQNFKETHHKIVRKALIIFLSQLITLLVFRKANICRWSRMIHRAMQHDSIHLLQAYILLDFYEIF